MKKTLFLCSMSILFILGSCKKDNPEGWQSGAEPDGYFSCDGRNYGYKVYGTQTWMTDNVAYLPYVVPSSTVSDSIPYYYVYGYEGTNPLAAKATENYQKYGVLCNWPAAKSNACPPGWHLPTDEEWKTLELFLGMSVYEVDDSNYRGWPVGLNMKSTTGWVNDRNGDNSSGFNVLPAGEIHGAGGVLMGFYGTFWTFSKYGYDPNKIWIRSFSWYFDEVGRNISERSAGFSVRCVKNL